jgi:4-alpha-glucanotransferase
MVDPHRWGVDTGYYDAAGVWQEPPASTVEAILTIMGADQDEPPPAPVVVVGPGRQPPAVGHGRLYLEDGSTAEVDGTLPADLPLGYHHLDGATHTRVIVSPGHCFLPDGLRVWGWAAQLYAARSRASWGIGDLADLRRLGEWSAGQGASLLLLNPLHAALPELPQQASPYFASSRCFRNPIYLRIEELPRAGELADLDRLAAAGRALNQDRRIDRDAVWTLKSQALEDLYAAFPGDPAFDRYRDGRGAALEGYATFCALGEEYGFHWEKWPEPVSHPDGPGVAAFEATEAGRQRIRYHAWLQWHLDQQLGHASGPLGLVHDLAIGTDPRGADAWLWQDSFALGVRVGAPPDEFNTLGQDWGLPPFDPWRLRAAAYEPFIQVLRAGMGAGAGLRFDHVMGLFRLFWIPPEVAPTEGTYVRYPWADLLDILALESHRAGAYVVGEDLGTVEDFVREELAARQVLSYRLLWFEPTPPDRGDWPTQALAAVTTHDLPTIVGEWTGTDLERQRQLDLHPNEDATLALRDKLVDWTGVPPDAPVEVVIERAYHLLGRAPCAIATATLDDALAVEERPNMPGTWPSPRRWRNSSRPPCLRPSRPGSVTGRPGLHRVHEGQAARAGPAPVAAGAAYQPRTGRLVAVVPLVEKLEVHPGPDECREHRSERLDPAVPGVLHARPAGEVVEDRDGFVVGHHFHYRVVFTDVEKAVGGQEAADHLGPLVQIG